MRTGTFWLLAAAGALWAQEPTGLAREGRYWVETVSGRASMERAGRLRVSSRGEITLRGEERADLGYSLKKRVKAESEEAARQLLRQFVLESARRAGWVELRLRPPARAEADAVLGLRAPSGLSEVMLVTQGGGIEAENLAGRLRAETGGGHVRLESIQGGLTVRTGGGNLRLGKIGGPVQCLSGGGSITAEGLSGEAELTTGGGEILVRRAGGPLRVATGGGNIRIERALSVTAATGGGLIDVLDTEGPVTAETAAGAIKVRAARGLRLNSGAGGIQLEGVRGPLRAATGVGNIVAALAPLPPFEDSQLSTDSGDITVFLPSNLAVTVEAIHAGGPGRIVSDFPEIQVRQAGAGTQARGRVNGGGPLLRLTASGGTIYLRRSQPSGAERSQR
jgi:DUF4097 and DUF4098 domain-containing protein YvlB